MTPDQAEAVISSSIQIEKKYKFGLKDKTINAAFVSGTILVSEKKDEYLILIHESRINNNKIVSVGRFSYKGNGQINESDLIASLVEKYGVGFKSNAEGKIYQSGGKRTVTGAGESACFVHMAGLSSAFEFTDDSGQPIDPSDMMHDDLRSVINNVSSLPWIGFDPSYLNDISKIKDCDINVAAWIPTNTGSLSGFMIWMSDLSGYAAELLRVINLPGANVDKGQKNFRL
ncbi:hypothetical protein [Bosea sp. R86505]|uniref:hypothetical protein n=1 Tax=Bosea sp. R86505 TaxID=3101710 RepID=UPI00366CBBF3